MAALLLVGPIFVVRAAWFGRKAMAARALTVMPAAKAFRAARGSWPGRPTELAPTYLEPDSAAGMEHGGFSFDLQSNGTFVVRWHVRGEPAAVDENGRFDPPMP